MTTGEYLVANSTLPSGTALQHLLALQIGTGSGPGQTVFASQFAVSIETPRTEVYLKPRRPAAEQVQKAASVDRSKDLKGLFCGVGSTTLFTGVSVDELLVGVGRQVTTATVRTEQASYTKKGLK